MAGNGPNREEGLFFSNNDPGLVSDATPFATGQVGKACAAPLPAGSASPANGQIVYVKRYATDTVAIVTGALAFWQDATAGVVTAEPASALGGTTAPIPAGVFLGTALAAGEYGFIQVAGEATVRLTDSTSAGTVGYVLVWNTNGQVKHVAAGTQVNQNFLPVVGVLKTLNTATGTNISCSALLSVPRLNW